LLVTAAACSKQEPAKASATPAVPSRSASSQAAGHIVSGKVPPSTGVTTIVLLQPRGDNAALPAPIGTPIMDQVARQFTPPMLFVRNGQRIEFRNSDDELHNVNVKAENEAKTQEFNVAIPVGGSYQYAFTREGLYGLTCDIHPDMTATVVVTNTPYAGVAGADGTFSFTNVAVGAYTFEAKTGASEIRRPVEVTEAQAVTTVDATRPAQ
jgi:hypothetical protein